MDFADELLSSNFNLNEALATLFKITRGMGAAVIKCSSMIAACISTHCSAAACTLGVHATASGFGCLLILALIGETSAQQLEASPEGDTAS